MVRTLPVAYRKSAEWQRGLGSPLSARNHVLNPWLHCDPLGEKPSKEHEKKRLSGLSTQSVGFLRSFTQLLARLPLALLAEALTGRLRSQGI